MRPKREANNSPQLSADFKNERNFHSKPTTNIRGVHADSFILNSTLRLKVRNYALEHADEEHYKALW
jgi:hypothetical protein